MTDQLVPAPAVERHLTAARFQGLADVPSELEWFANIDNKSARRAYENALQDFMRFAGPMETSLASFATPASDRPPVEWLDALVVKR